MYLAYVQWIPVHVFSRDIKLLPQLFSLKLNPPGQHVFAIELSGFFSL